jgi:hypothetical protein
VARQSLPVDDREPNFHLTPGTSFVKSSGDDLASTPRGARLRLIHEPWRTDSDPFGGVPATKAVLA